MVKNLVSGWLSEVRRAGWAKDWDSFRPSTASLVGYTLRQAHLNLQISKLTFRSLITAFVYVPREQILGNCKLSSASFREAVIEMQWHCRSGVRVCAFLCYESERRIQPPGMICRPDRSVGWAPAYLLTPAGSCANGRICSFEWMDASAWKEYLVMGKEAV